jgi:hypothetical protein
MRTALSVCLILACGACADQPPPLDPPLPGSNYDAHGCVPADGYTWCQRTQRCERPWRLAQREWFDMNKQAYEGYCGNAQQ